MKTLKIIPKGMCDRENVESGNVGECSALMNMRERENSLQSVGEWKELGDISVGEKVLLVDNRLGVENVLTCRGSVLYLHGKIVGEDYAELKKELCRCEGNILWGKSTGDFVVVGTTEGCIYMYYNGTDYEKISREDFAPQLMFKAVSAGVVSATIAGTDFESEYTRWSTIKEKDHLILQKSVTDAYYTLLNNAKQKGAYVQPVAVRYAVRLWDDSYVWISAPIVVGMGIQVGTTTSAQVDALFSGYEDSVLSANMYNIGVEVMKGPSEHVRPFIKSVDILVSEELEPYIKGKVLTRCEKSQTTSAYYITYGLLRKEQKVAESGIINPEKWNVLAQVTDVGKLGELSKVLRSGVCTEKLSRDVVKNIIQTINHDVVANTALSLNGRLYTAGHYHLVRNAWHSVQFWGGSVTGVPCEVIVTSRIRTLHGDVVKVSRESYDVSPTSLNAMIAYPDSRAVELSVKILSGGSITEWNGVLDGVDEQGFAYFINEDLSENKLVEGYSFYEQTEQNTREPALTEFVINREGNPWIVEQRRLIGQLEVYKIEVATKPIFSGVFGRYPIYAFATDGVYAVAYKEQGDYKDAQLISHRKLSENKTIAVCDDGVFFMSSENELCRLAGKDLQVLMRIENVSQMAWVGKYSELLLRRDDNVVTVYMPSGKCYDRSEGLSSVYCDFKHALGVDISGKLRNLNSETVCNRDVYAETYPVAVKECELMAPLRLTVNMSGVFNQIGSIELYGSDGVTCDWRKLGDIAISGKCCHHLSTRVYAPPCRLFKLRLSGNAGSGMMFRNAELLYN